MRVPPLRQTGLFRRSSHFQLNEHLSFGAWARTGLWYFDGIFTENLFQNADLAWEFSPYDIDREELDNPVVMQYHDYCRNGPLAIFYLHGAKTGLHLVS